MNLKTFVSYLLILLGAFFSNAQQKQKVLSELKGAYLGQKPPGLIPEIFAPGIITTDINEHSPAAFSPDGNEVFWSVTDGRSLTIKYMKNTNGKWSPPETAPFARDLECSSPVFSYDGKKLYFTSQNLAIREILLWYVEKTANGWSEAKKADAIINTGYLGYQVSLTKDGTIYFDTEGENGNGATDIYRSKLINGKYTEPENLGNNINSKDGESSVFIAPDESFILFRRVKRIERDISLDFFISYRKSDHSWSKPIDIGKKLNAESGGFWIGMSPDGKYVFFVKTNQNRQSDLYWVDAKVLDEFK